MCFAISDDQIKKVQSQWYHVHQTWEMPETCQKRRDFPQNVPHLGICTVAKMRGRVAYGNCFVRQQAVNFCEQGLQ